MFYILIYIYIYIVVVQVIRPTTVKPQRELDSFNSAYKIPGKLVPARRCLCDSPAAACAPEFCFPMNQRLRFICAYKNQ